MLIVSSDIFKIVIVTKKWTFRRQLPSNDTTKYTLHYILLRVTTNGSIFAYKTTLVRRVGNLLLHVLSGQSQALPWKKWKEETTKGSANNPRSNNSNNNNNGIVQVYNKHLNAATTGAQQQSPRISAHTHHSYICIYNIYIRALNHHLRRHAPRPPTVVGQKTRLPPSKIVNVVAKKKKPKRKNVCAGESEVEKITALKWKQTWSTRMDDVDRAHSHTHAHGYMDEHFVGTRFWWQLSPRCVAEVVRQLIAFNHFPMMDFQNFNGSSRMSNFSSVPACDVAR